MFKLLAATVATVTALSAETAIEGVKGFYDGYHFGLYKKTAHSVDECLDKTTEDNIEAVIDDLMDLANISSKVFALMGQLTEIWQDIQVCHFQDLALDMIAYCSDSGNCGFGSIAGAVQTNMFALMGKITALGELIGRGIPEEASEMRAMAKQAGEDIGTIVRDITGFEKVTLVTA